MTERIFKEVIMLRWFSFLSVLALVALVACSTAKVNVMPGEDGVNKVLVRDIERDDAEEEAVNAANKYCEKQNKHAVFMHNKTDYQGSMDEGTRNTVRKASRAAQVVGAGMGGVGYGVGDSGTAIAGGVLGSAGTVGGMMTNDRDYKTEVLFKCK